MDSLWYGDKYGLVDKKVYNVVQGGYGCGDVMLDVVRVG